MSSPDLPEPSLADLNPPQSGPRGGRCCQFSWEPYE
jgi:hypothetical protein